METTFKLFFAGKRTFKQMNDIICCWRSPQKLMGWAESGLCDEGGRYGEGRSCCCCWLGMEEMKPRLIISYILALL